MRLALGLLFAVALAGCPDNNNPPATDSGVDAHAHDELDAPLGGGPSCESIIAACHDVDIGTGRIAECHDTAHDAASTEATCAAIVEECVALCTAVDAGPPSDQDAGAHMH